MSSLRNAVKRVTHKERSQPHHRKKLGLLEKHSDYVERANDFKKKRLAIRTLKVKASERNQDEFYFKMHKSEIQGGKHREIAERNKSLDNATVQLLKTQDMGYIVHKKSVDDKKIDKLKNNLHLIGAVLPRHKIFCETKEEVENFDVTEHFETLPGLVHRAYNRPRAKDIESLVANSTNPLETSEKLMKSVNKKISSSYEELSKRVQRRDKISKVVKELQLQRHLMGKGSKRKIAISKVGEDGAKEEKFIYKWKKQRSR